MRSVFDSLSEFQKGVTLMIAGVMLMSLGLIGVRYVVLFFPIDFVDIFFWGALGAFFFSLPILFRSKNSYQTVVYTIKNYPKTVLISGVITAFSAVIWSYLIVQFPADTVALFDQLGIVWSLIFGVLFLGERALWMQLLGMCIAGSGILFMYYSDMSFGFWNFLLLMINPIIYALQSLVLKVYGKGIDGFTFSVLRLFLVFVFAGTFYICFYGVSVPPVVIILILGLCQFFGMVVGRMFATMAHEYLPISQLNFFFILMPVFALIATPFIEIDYVFQLWKYFGAGLILVGIVLFLWKKEAKSV